MNAPIHLVVTTINYPAFLNDVLSNSLRHGRAAECKVWIVGDLKTPAQTSELASSLSRQGLETVYLDVAAQDRIGQAIPEFYKRLPLNNECRRNIGYWKALSDGCQILLSMDDDNFPCDDDLLGGHMKTGTEWSGEMLSDQSGFYNVCEHLEFDPPRQVYPRGFPFRLRNKREQRESRFEPIEGKDWGDCRVVAVGSRHRRDNLAQRCRQRFELFWSRSAFACAIELDSDKHAKHKRGSRSHSGFPMCPDGMECAGRQDPTVRRHLGRIFPASHYPGYGLSCLVW